MWQMQFGVKLSETASVGEALRANFNLVSGGFFAL